MALSLKRMNTLNPIGTRLGSPEAETDFQGFFAPGLRLNPAREAVTGLICGIRVETIEEPLMREIRTLDKLIDELAKGKTMEKILRA